MIGTNVFLIVKNKYFPHVEYSEALQGQLGGHLRMLTGPLQCFFFYANKPFEF